MRFGTQGVYSPANWMQLSCIVFLKYTCQGLLRSFALTVKLKVKWIQKEKYASSHMERKRPMSEYKGKKGKKLLRNNKTFLTAVLFKINST